MLALRRLLPEAEVELIAPVDEFVYRPLAIREPFGDGLPDRFALSGIVEVAAARYRRDAVTTVDRASRSATLASGGQCRFDALLVAIGARPVEAVPGSITFWGQDGDPAFARALQTLGTDGRARMVFAVPHRVRWSLPLYELALLTADHLREQGQVAELSFVTPEPEPLSVFGGDVSAELKRMLDQHGIALHLSTDPVEYCAQGERTHGPGDEIAVSLPRLVGRGLPDLPVDDHHFLPTDDFGRVLGAPGFYAAGDVTDSPIKQGGLGTQQADAAASAIAADLGAGLDPEPFEAVLRGRVMTEGEPRFLHRDLHGTGASVVDRSPLWWPGAKIFGRHIAPFLAALATSHPDLLSKAQSGSSPIASPRLSAR